MSQRLKRWESPRREGRNSKGKGGSARHRQVKKQQQMLRSRLKDNSQQNDSSGKRPPPLPSFFGWIINGSVGGEEATGKEQTKPVACPESEA